MPLPNLGPQYDFAARITALEDRLARLESNPIGQAFSTTQSDGSVGLSLGIDSQTGSFRWIVYQGSTTARDPNTAQHPALMYLGELVDGTGAFVDSGLIMFRPDGSESLVVGSGGVGVKDTAGNIVFSTDATSGQGLARPYIPAAFYPARNGDFLTSTAASFETVWRAKLGKQQPKLYAECWAFADTAGTTGQVQVMVNGVQLDATASVTNSAVTLFTFGPAAVAGAFGVTLNVEIQAQRTAGTGNIQVGAAWVQGMQS